MLKKRYSLLKKGVPKTEGLYLFRETGQKYSVLIRIYQDDLGQLIMKSNDRYIYEHNFPKSGVYKKISDIPIKF